jgi:hypothetical protein
MQASDAVPSAASPASLYLGSLGPERIVADGIARYFAARRDRVPAFVDAHFSLRGTARLHRAALGWDILKAPANITLALPELLGGVVTRLTGRRMPHLLLRTAVSREIEWLIATELLEVPFRQGERVAAKDALAETILADPELAGTLRLVLESVGRRGDDPAFRARLEQALLAYAGSRAAAAEIATSLVTLGAGALTLNKLTPGVVTLGPSLAAIMAQQAAIASFPLGAGLGGLWYGWFPAAPSALLVTGLTGGLMLGAASLAAFAGLVTDPLQRSLGLHQRRLLRMLDALERQMHDPAAPAFRLRDQYVARLTDLLDLLGAAYRLAHA